MLGPEDIPCTLLPAMERRFPLVLLGITGATYWRQSQPRRAMGGALWGWTRIGKTLICAAMTRASAYLAHMRKMKPPLSRCDNPPHSNNLKLDKIESDGSYIKLLTAKQFKEDFGSEDVQDIKDDDLILICEVSSESYEFLGKVMSAFNFKSICW
jgi:hypothetical protein